MTSIEAMQTARSSSQRSQLAALQGGTNLSGNAGGREIDEKLMSVCRDFESIFIKQLLDAMRKTVTRSGLINRGMGEEIFEDMLYDEYAKKMTLTANLGISRLLYNQLALGSESV
jgi:Rod binding domain-containing protein